jgi:hypothetical protein
MTPLEERLAISAHEALHATTAWALGFRVDECTIDRIRLDNGSAGGTWWSTRSSDSRSPELKAMCRAMVHLAPVTGERRLPAWRSDNDVHKADIIIADYGLSDLLVREQLRDLLQSEFIRRGAAWVSLELYDRRVLEGSEVHELLNKRLAAWRDDIFFHTETIVQAVERDAPFIASRLVEQVSELDLLKRLAALERDV